MSPIVICDFRSSLSRRSEVVSFDCAQDKSRMPSVEAGKARGSFNRFFDMTRSFTIFDLLFMIWVESARGG